MYKDHFMSLTSEVSIVELDKALRGRSSYNLTQYLAEVSQAGSTYGVLSPRALAINVSSISPYECRFL